MSLNIEGTTVRAECINHPNDVYVYFDGGHFVWNILIGEPQGVWWNGDMFLFAKWKFVNGKEAAIAFNEWAEEQCAVAIA